MWTALNWHQHSSSNTYAYQKGCSLSYLIYSSIQCDICHIILFLNTNESSLKNSEIWELSCCDLRNTINLHHNHNADLSTALMLQTPIILKGKELLLTARASWNSVSTLTVSLIKLIFCKWQANTILWKTDYHKNSRRKPDSNQACVSRELSFAQETGWSAVMEEYPTRINCS